MNIIRIDRESLAHRSEKTTREIQLDLEEQLLGIHLVRVPRGEKFPSCLSASFYLSRFVAHTDTRGVHREVNDSCRQFVHKHVPVTLLERRATGRGAAWTAPVDPRELARALSSASVPLVSDPTSGMAEENRTPFTDIRISFIHTNFGTNLDLRELSATRSWQSARTTLEPEQRSFDVHRSSIVA